MSSNTATKIAHPYYPRNLHLPNYVPNDKSVVELLGVFFGIVSVFICFIWFYSGRKSREHSLLGRCKLCWFLACGLIHTILEGYFSFFHRTLAGEQTYLAQMWKEYGKGDSRYVSSDTFTVCMELITAVVDGPLALLAVYAFLRRRPYRYIVQLVLSAFQLYGDTLYFMTEVKEDFSHGDMWHPLYFWFYFVFLNLIWIVVPLLCIGESVIQLSLAQNVSDRDSGSQRTASSNGTSNGAAKKKK